MSSNILELRKGGLSNVTAEQDVRVLVASNRLPVTAIREGSKVRLARSSGGLVSGLRHLENSWPVRWYGWSGVSNDAQRAEELSLRAGAALVAVPMNDSEVDGHYRNYCNSLLWPVLHGMSENVVCEPGAWQHYARVNVRFADALLADLRPGDRVWVHDYHLLLVPQLLRMRTAALDNRVAFFLHTPFPEPEEFTQVAQHAELVRGMLGADVIGFHTEEYAQNFLNVAQALGYEVRDRAVLVGGRSAQVTVRPMGLDAESFVRLGSDPDVLHEVQRLRRTHKRILLGVDRLDYTKGIPQRLLAFEALLHDRPELRGEVSLLQIAVPTRSESPSYMELRSVVEEIVERVNRSYGTSSWTPIEYLYDTIDLNTLAALYRAADVMLVTPCRDGLNLVAKEFVATRVDGDGVLVLSKFAGVAKELTSALFVDPHAVSDLASALYDAITMSLPERKRRMKKMIAAVTSNSINGWIRHFVGEAKRRVVIA